MARKPHESSIRTSFTLRRRRASLCVIALVVLLGLVGAQPAAAAGLAIAQAVTTNQTATATSISSPTFSTTGTNRLLVAFITSDGPSAGTQTFSTVTGGGLTWRLRQRTNAQLGTSEIWQAVAPSVVMSARVTATRSSGSYLGSITVVEFSGADMVASGATAAASAATGAPSVSLMTTRAGSWVWGVGDDWDRPAARTVGATQTKVSEFLASSGDTFWVQRQTSPTPLSGSVVTLNDTAPTTDRWNLAAIEILPASAAADTQAPTAPTGLAAGTVTATRVDLSWSASTDDVGVSGYRVYRGGSQIADVAGTTVSDSTVAAGTTYSYTVKAYDAAGNLSAASTALTVMTPTPPPDTTPPTVSISAPANGATVTGTVSVTATAADDVGIVGVQFLLDGANLGGEDSAAPYGTSWDSSTAGSGSHTLSARARDAAGNTTTSATITVTVNASAGDPAVVGQWGPLYSIPAVAIHSALLPSGRIVLFQGDFAMGGQQYVFNPQTGSTTQVPNASADLFCAGQAVLADGRVLVVGGTSTSGGLGVPDVTAFEWQSESWRNLAPMRYPRWYATATTLSDGKVLAVSGANTSSTDLVPIPELYSPNTNSWQSLTAATKTIPFYPFVYQLPDGRVVYLGASEVATASEALNLATNQWTTIDARKIDGGSIANYAPGKFIKAGSASDSGFSGPSLKTAYTLDMNQSGATWQPTADMAFQRSFLNLTNLPDGTVLATGGGTDKSGEVDANSVLKAEDWDPASGAWKTYSAMSAGRLYHSVAVLLPDGRVYVSGGGGDPGVPDQRSVQIFSPPYLFKGTRPTINSAPATVHWNTTASVGTADPSSIARVSLIRTGSVTHSFDQNARALSLSFTRTANGVDVQMPADGNYAPPGYYMLFLVNSQGVPSVASFVRFPAPYEDSVAPGAPANLTATAQLSGAALTWTAATDDVAVTGYDVYRSTTPGFTASAANRIGQSATTSFNDSGLAPGTYYYRVTARDAAGNVGPASNEASAAVQADGTPPTAPANLQATAGAQSASLSWTAATDNVGVTGYRVIRNGAQVGTPSSTAYTDTGLTPATAYTYTVAAVDAAGNVGPSSDPVTVTTAAVATLALDRTVTTRQSAAAPAISSPPVSTSQPGELLLALLASDGPSGAASQTFSTVTGGGLTWTLRRRANAQAGTAEIWQAVAPSTLSNVVVTATRSSGSYQGSITVAALTGADTTTPGATASASAVTGAPTVTLTSTRAGSWGWGVGDDWDAARARTLGTGQTMVDEFLASSGDTFWSQRRDTVTATAGTAIAINDTAPTTDRWNLAAVEVLPATSGLAGQ